MDGIILTPLKIIQGDKGAVMHAIKAMDVGYKSFGEAYFSTVKHMEIKGWKRHNRMTLNIVVPCGEIEFKLYNGKDFQTIRLSPNNYQRLTVTPGIWMAFRGIGSDMNLLLNIADMPHSPDEISTMNLSELPYEH